MDNEYLTIKQAVNFTNKSQTVITRLASKLEDSEHVKRISNRFLVSKNYLIEYFKISENQSTNQKTNQTDNKNYFEIIQLLKNELQQKDKELDQKNKQIESLHKMLENSQIMIQSLQVQKQITEKSQSFWDNVKRMFLYKSE